ncbi:MAG: hypothetical protein ABIA47_01330 [bacterium]
MFHLWYLLIPYIAFVLLAFIFLFFNLFDVSQFGLQSNKTTIVLTAYVGGFLAVLIVSTTVLITIDWSQSFSMSQIINIAAWTGL